MKHELIRTEEKIKSKFDLILLLQPTCPYRDAKDLKKILYLINKKNYDSAISVSEVGAFHPERMKIFRNKYLKNFSGKKAENMTPRQSLSKVYIRSGSYYMIKRHSFLNIKV